MDYIWVYKAIQYIILVFFVWSVSDFRNKGESVLLVRKSLVVFIRFLYPIPIIVYVIAIFLYITILPNPINRVNTKNQTSDPPLSPDPKISIICAGMRAKMPKNAFFQHFSAKNSALFALFCAFLHFFATFHTFTCANDRKNPRF